MDSGKARWTPVIIFLSFLHIGTSVLLQCATPSDQLVIANSKGEITSPVNATTGLYPSHQQCLWNFITDKDKYLIIFRFDELDIQKNTKTCDDQYCVDRNGSFCIDDVNIGVEPRYSICGAQNPSACFVLTTDKINPDDCINVKEECGDQEKKHVIANTTKFQIGFYSDGDQQRKGFKVKYQILPCKKKSTGFSGNSEYELPIPILIGASVGGSAFIILLVTCLCMLRQRKKRTMEDDMKKSTYTPGNFRYGTMYHKSEKKDSGFTPIKDKLNDPFGSSKEILPIYAKVEKRKKEKRLSESLDDKGDRIMVDNVLYLKHDRNSRVIIQHGTTSTFQQQP